MSDDFPTYEPGLLSDANRESLRTLISRVRKDNGWANRLEQAMDSENYWRSRASKPTADDSELQGEIDLLRAKVATLQSELADVKREAEAARLFVETQTAAAAHRAEESQLEPVGWACRDENRDAFIHFCDKVPDAQSGSYMSFGHKMSYAEPLNGSLQFLNHRRVYLGPAEPLPLEVTP